MSDNQSLLTNISQLLAIIGIIDTVYLINLHYSSGTCIGELQYIGTFLIDCGSVAKSEYSEIFGIPIALFGFLYYLSIFLIYQFHKHIENILPEGITAIQTVFVIVTTGFIISMYLLYLQLGVLQLICSYCMLSIAVTTLLVGVHGYFLFLASSA